MPRKDPITGCEVATLGEVMHKIGEAEGKSAADLMTEMLDECDAEREREEQRLRVPDTALAELRERLLSWNEGLAAEDRYEIPVRVHRVLEASVTWSAFGGGSGMRLVVEAERADGTRGTLTYTEWSSPGSFYEPPDGEAEASWA